MPMINRMLFHTFLSVYRTGSQTKAAQELCLTQPAISQQIKQLEQHIGRPLFNREGKNLVPTTFAHQLAFNINGHIDALDKIWESFKPSTKSIAGTVHLGGIAEFFAAVIALHLAPLNQQGIQIRFEIGHDTLLEKLLHGELDLAQFCAHIVHPGITLERLSQQTYWLVGAPCWLKKIASKDLKMGDTSSLDHIPWIAYDESLLFIKDYYQHVFNKAFTGRVALMIKDLWSLTAAAMGGAGITVLPSYFCQQQVREKKLLILHQPIDPPRHHFYLGWKDGALVSPRIAAVRQLLHASVKKSKINIA